MSTGNTKDVYYWGRQPQYIYEDEQCVVFDEEVNPQAPIHFLVVPKKIIPRLSHVTDDEEQTLGHLLIVARKIANARGLQETGFRVVINDGPDACQIPELIFVQVFGGRQMGHLLIVAKNMAYEKGLEGNGYHVIVDEDPRSVRLKAIHVFGRALHHMLGYGPGAKL